MRGGWVGPKDDCLLASLGLDPFCDTYKSNIKVTGLQCRSLEMAAITVKLDTLLLSLLA